MTTRMTINGVSTCAEAGTEKYRKLSFFHCITPNVLLNHQSYIHSSMESV